tara:strand:+ start:138 stop:359 length:222 start_codon:yes stop_codon:yes gene_type:complete
MFGWIKRAAVWVAGVAAIIFAAWMAGRRDQRQQAAVETAESYIKTRKEIDDVESNIGDDPAVLREWLRQRGKQ